MDLNLKCSICGMKINEKNIEYNNEALLIKNTILSIRYCPFCGVSSIYLNNSEEILSVDFKSLDSKTLNILDHAMKLEIFNGDYYTEASRLSLREENKKLFSSLANIEYMHARVHGRFIGTKEMPSLTKLNYTKYNDDEFLSMAKLRETHAVEFYNRNYKETSNEGIKMLFKALSSVEEEHIILTSK